MQRAVRYMHNAAPFMAPIPFRTVMRIRGNDTVKFLQGMVTNNMNLLSERPGIYTAFLNPQVSAIANV